MAYYFLAAVDRDTPSENITFVIISATRGYIALKKNRYLSVDKFTQEQINNKEVLVIHDGKVYFIACLFYYLI